MRTLLPFILGVSLVACAPVAQDRISERLSEIEIKLTRLEQKQIDLEKNLERTNERIDRQTELFSELRLEVERLRLRVEAGLTEKTAPPPEKTPAGTVSAVAPAVPAEKVPPPPTELGEEKPPEEEAVGEKPAEEEEDAETAYRKAIELYSIKKLYEARNAFLSFIKKFPENRYTDNAFFWIGKIHQELGDTDRAENVYKVLVEKCEGGKLPDCNKLPDAYYQLMRIYMDRGDTESADRYYSLLLEKFPTSDAAVRAREHKALMGE